MKEPAVRPNILHVAFTLPTGQDYLEVQWGGYVQVEEIKQGLQHSVALMRENSLRKVLHEATAAMSAFSMALPWMFDTFLPSLPTGEVLGTAVVAPVDFTTRQYLNEAVNLVRVMGYPLGLFDTKAEAIAWLRTVSPAQPQPNT